MANKFTNNAVGYLSSVLSENATVINLQSGGDKFPDIATSDDDYFYATLVGLDSEGRENAWEIVKVTGTVSNTFLAAIAGAGGRAQMGTNAQEWPAGTKIALRLTAEHAENASTAYDWGNHASPGYAIPTGSQATLKTDSFQVVFGQTYLLGTATGKTISVPLVNANNEGQMFRLRDPFGTLQSNPWTIDYVGNAFGTGKIQGLAQDMVLDISRYKYDFIYSSPTNSWYLI